MSAAQPNPEGGPNEPTTPGEARNYAASLAIADTMMVMFMLYQGITAPTDATGALDIAAGALITIDAVQEWWASIHAQATAAEMDEPEDESRETLHPTSAFNLLMFGARVYSTVLAAESARVNFVEGNGIALVLALGLTAYSAWRSYAVQDGLIDETTGTIQDLRERRGDET